MSGTHSIDRSSPRLFCDEESLCPAPKTEELVCSAENANSYSTQVPPKAPDSNLPAKKGSLAYFGLVGLAPITAVAGWISCSSSDSYSQPVPDCDNLVEDVCFHEGTVERHPNGKLKSGVLAITVEPQAVQGRELKASNKVFFSPDGRLEAVEIAADQEILGHWWKGGTRVEFHLSDGSVSKGVLAKDQEVQWIEWKGGTALEFYPDSHGNVFRGTLAKDQEMLASGVKLQGVDGIKFKGGQPLELHLNRSVQYGYLAGRQHIQGIEWQGDESMIFHPNGTVSEGTLARDQEIPVLGEKIRWRAATIMALHSNGGVHRGTLAFDQKIQGINFAAPTKCVNPPGTPFNACDEGEIELHRVILNPHGSLVSGTMRNGSGRLVSYFIPGPTPERH